MINLTDTIQIEWHIDDVKSIDSGLSDDDARTVLGYIERKHDATIGISWQTIEDAIDYLRDNGGIQ